MNRDTFDAGKGQQNSLFLRVFLSKVKNQTLKKVVLRKMKPFESCNAIKINKILNRENLNETKTWMELNETKYGLN